MIPSGIWRFILCSGLFLGLLLGIACASPENVTVGVMHLESDSVVVKSGNFTIAPVNPDFEIAIKNYTPILIEKGRTFGYIPPLIDITKPASYGHRILTTWMVPLSDVPSKYDLRTIEKVTPVRDQGRDGTCWAFGTYASLESFLLPSEGWDFSEQNMKCAFERVYPNGSGNVLGASAYLVRWNGPVNETDDPYQWGDNTRKPPLPVQKHVQEVLFIPGGDTYLIKNAIMKFGAVASSFYFNDITDEKETRFPLGIYFNYFTDSYFYPQNGDVKDSNHLVAIVGWNDYYSRTNFSPLNRPSTDGAWLIKNSHGTDWNPWGPEKGYYWVSYEDKWLTKKENAVITAEPPDNFQSIYQHDLLGVTEEAGYGSEEAWYAAAFTAESYEDLTAVETFTPVPDSGYVIEIYTGSSNQNPRSGTLRESIRGSIPLAGYHTVFTSKRIILIPGERFSVVVHLETPGNQFPIAIENNVYALTPKGEWVPYYTGATNAPYQSYVSAEGNVWADINTAYSNLNTYYRDKYRREYPKNYPVEQDKPDVCIKAFTSFAGEEALNRINRGDYVFIGEQDLDVTAALQKRTSIAYYGPDTLRSVPENQPLKIITLTLQDASMFDIEPAIFSERPGPWYIWPLGDQPRIAFFVEEPSVEVRIWDSTKNRELLGDSTGRISVLAGTFLNFRIDSPLYLITSRDPDAPGQCRINLTGPDSTNYSYLVTASGGMKSLRDIELTEFFTFWQPFIQNGWNTGTRSEVMRWYPSGNYKLTAECNPNKLTIRSKQKIIQIADTQGWLTLPPYQGKIFRYSDTLQLPIYQQFLPNKNL